MNGTITFFYFTFLTLSNLLLTTQLKTGIQLLLLALIVVILLNRKNKEAVLLSNFLFYSFLTIITALAIFNLGYLNTSLRQGSHFTMDLSIINYLFIGVFLAPLIVYGYHYYLRNKNSKAESYFVWVFSISYTAVTLTQTYFHNR
jgi:hypothetical protein